MNNLLPWLAIGLWLLTIIVIASVYDTTHQPEPEIPTTVFYLAPGTYYVDEKVDLSKVEGGTKFIGLGKGTTRVIYSPKKP